SAGIERSFAAFMESYEAGVSPTVEWTEFRYDLGSEAAYISAELPHQLGAIPYILAFNDAIRVIRIVQHGRLTTYRISRDKTVDMRGQARLVSIESGDPGSSPPLRLAVLDTGEARVAVRLVGDTPAAMEIDNVGEVPRLFAFLPLVGTSDLGLPVVAHNPSFCPTEERDGIHLAGGPRSRANKAAFEACSAVIVAMARACSGQGWRGLHRLLRIERPRRSEALKGDDEGWFVGLQKRLLEALADLALVETSGGRVSPLRQVIVPV